MRTETNKAAEALREEFCMELGGLLAHQAGVEMEEAEEDPEVDVREKFNLCGCGLQEAYLL